MYKTGKNTSHSVLTGLLVLSAFIHVGIIYFLPENKIKTQEPVIISANIVYPSQSSGSLIKPEKITKRTYRQPAKNNHVSRKSNTTSTSTSLSTGENIQTVNPPRESINWFEVKQRIKASISKDFSYPRLAIRNGWQGTVMLAFKINFSGEIFEQKVSKTSGYRILDQAALKSLLEIKHINISKNIQYYNPVSIELPVIFRLNES